MTEVKVKVHTIEVKDLETGDLYTVFTVRSAQFITEYLQETERDAVQNQVEEAVYDALVGEEERARKLKS